MHLLWGDLAQAFHAGVKDGRSLSIGEWFMLKCLMGDGAVFRGVASTGAARNKKRGDNFFH